MNTPYSRLNDHVKRLRFDKSHERDQLFADIDRLAYPKFEITEVEGNDLSGSKYRTDLQDVKVTAKLIVGDRIYTNSLVVNGYLIRDPNGTFGDNALEWARSEVKQNLLHQLLEELS